MTTRRVAFVLSGHVHQYRVLDVEGARHIWAPTTWAVLPDSLQPRLGDKICAVIDVDLLGGDAFAVGVSKPPGMQQWTLGDDIVSPYAH